MQERADCKKAQEESNLESEAAAQSFKIRPQRRVRRRLMQAVSSSSEEEGGSDAETHSVLSPPPPPPIEQLYEPVCKYYNNYGVIITFVKTLQFWFSTC